MGKLTEEVWIIERLKQIGFLVPLDSVDLYHGRANTTGEPFRVDPTHAGVGSYLPNMSLTTDYEGAKYVAESRSGDKFTPEIHKMVSLGGKYYFINTDMRLSADSVGKENDCWSNFSTRHLIRQGAKYMEERSIGLNESFPIEQGMEGVYDQVYSECAKLITDKHPFILQEDIETVFTSVVEANKTNRKYLVNPDKFMGTVREIVTQFAGSINARTWLLDNPGAAIYGYMQKPNTPGFSVSGGLTSSSVPFSKLFISAGMFERLQSTLGNKNIPINWNYMATWLKKNNIVGGVSTRNSDTVGKRLPVYFLLDLDTVKTESEQSQIYSQIINKYGELISTLSQVSNNPEITEFLASATPSECIDFINKSKTHPNLATLSTGTWEGYSVGEHTEAVLKIYEENFARTLPEELQPFMKLTLLLHDIGKGSSVQKTGMKNPEFEHKETASVCKDLFSELGVDKQTSEIMKFIMLDSQEFTTDFYIHRNAGAEQQLLQAIRAKYMQVYNTTPTEGQVNGIASMCKILQTCDSYSYTPNATIRRTGENGDIYVRGANANFGRNSVTGRHTVEYTRPDGGEHASDPYNTNGGRKK